MLALSSIKDLFIILSIAGLLIVGVGITLRSGLAASGRAQRLQVLGNLSQMILALVGCTAILSMVQQLVGYRMRFMP